MFLKERMTAAVKKAAQAGALAVALLVGALAGKALLVKVGILATLAFALIVPGGAVVVLVVFRLMAHAQERERQFQLVWADYQRRERSR